MKINLCEDIRSFPVSSPSPTFNLLNIGHNIENKSIRIRDYLHMAFADIYHKKLLSCSHEIPINDIITSLPDNKWYNNTVWIV